MELATRKFARKVLIIHLILLIGVIVVVIIAAAGVYHSSRKQAIAQAEQREELLAKQTAKGIESYYRSILSDLELIRRSEQQESPESLVPTTRPARGATTRPRLADIGAQTLPRFGPFTAGLIWRQLQGRASHLFIVEHKTAAVTLSLPLDEPNLPRVLARNHAKWLESLQDAAISPFLKFTGSGNGGHMIAVPGVGGRAIVAVVPIESVRKNFFDPLNKERGVSAVLIEKDGDAMVAVDPRLVGKSVVRLISDPQVQAVIRKHIVEGQNGAWVIEKPTDLSGITLPPRVAAAETITSLPGQRWTVMIMSPLDEINAVVNPIFNRAILWAAFVVVAMTAILFSTSLQLIRGRTRLERFRHDMLRRELKRARDIQLAWLPRKPPECPAVDIAALNQPASHISGDFYNWFDLPDGRLAVCIGDVTGHGMSAAFLMATTQLLVRTTLPRINDPGQCLAEVNRQLCHQHFSGQFVTMLLLVVDHKSGTMELATAGHLPPMVSSDGHFSTLELEPQLVLGVDPESQYSTQGYPLSPQTVILLFTDGLLDAQSPNGERFGASGLSRHLSPGVMNPKSLLDKLMQSVLAFCQARELSDDLTAVALHYRPPTIA